jgi:acetyl esterase/lipase
MGGDICSLTSGSSAISLSARETRLWHLVKHIVEMDSSSKERSDHPYTATLDGYDMTEPTNHVWDYWLSSRGTLLDALTGQHGLGEVVSAQSYDERTAAVPTKHAQVIPQLWLHHSDEATSFPPTLLVHGTADEAVPYEESVNTQRQLERRGVDVELVTVRGANHNLQQPGVLDDAEGTLAAHARTVAWLEKALS